MPSPAVAIIIPLHNEARTIGACVRSVLARTDYPSWELIVVDDGSTDGGAEQLQAFPQVRLLSTPRSGVAHALNLAIAAAVGKDIVRLHADVVIVAPDWLTRLVEAAYAHSQAGVVGARLIYPDGRIASEGRLIVAGLGMHPQHCSLRAFEPDGPPTPVREVDTVAGALAYYRRETIDRVGGLDERYGPAWMEDDDFCVAARRHGFKVYVHGGVKALHFTRALSPTRCPTLPEEEPEITKLLGLGKIAYTRAQAEYWEAKWGWNPFAPDLGEIRRIYGGTEICWRIGESLRYRPSGPAPTVDCCLVTYNSRALLRRCLESLARTDYPADRLKVYVTDNASTDGTAEFLSELAQTYPFRLHPLRLAVNAGCPVGLNFAVTAGQGELVARLDDDIVLPPDWLRVLAADLERRPFAGCVGPKIINDDDRHSVQCGPLRQFPSCYNHEGEPDQGQADYLARAMHVRGCCNLYRRDVFTRGLAFDARFSPSQWDDPDHHIALLQSGYEVLYDGRVGVVHKLSSGSGRSAAAQANFNANCAKFFGKWGTDVWEVLDRSLELSREGRYLPEDGDTSAWLELGPPPSQFPRQVGASWNRHGAALTAAYDALSAADTREDIRSCVDEYLDQAALVRSAHSAGRALDTLHSAANLAPTRADALAALAETYVGAGQGGLARTIAGHGLLLHPADPRLQVLAAPPASVEGASTEGRRDHAAAETRLPAPPRAAAIRTSPSLRVLLVIPFERPSAEVGLPPIERMRASLDSLGVELEVCDTPRPDPRHFDVIHLWSTEFPAQTLAQAKAVRAARPEMPVVLTPRFADRREQCWAEAAIPEIVSQSPTRAQLDERLALVAADRVAFHGHTRQTAGEPSFSGYDAYQRAIFPLVDHLLPHSRAEIACLKKLHGIALPFTIARVAVDATVCSQTEAPEWVAAFAGRAFVLCAGPVEPSRNQLLLLHSLRDTGIPVVVAGKVRDRSYGHLCRIHAPAGSQFIDEPAPGLVAGAFRSASVIAHPYWVEGVALDRLDSALGGGTLVVSDRTAEREYFGSSAYYCDPANVASIRSAVLRALENRVADAPKRSALAARCRFEFTWDAKAAAMVAGYRAAIAARLPGRLHPLAPATLPPLAAVA